MDTSERRAHAAARFETDGFPTVHEEAWRFTDVTPMAQVAFKTKWAPSELDFQPLSKVVFVFENGRLSYGKSTVDGLPEGVRVSSIMDQEDPRIGTLADAESGFVFSNTAYFKDGAFIEVDEGVVFDEPIHLVHLADVEKGVFHLRNFIDVAAGAKLTVIEEYVGAGTTMYWTNVVTEVFAADGADVDHYKIQSESASAFHFQTLEIRLGKEGLFRNHAVTIGGALGRNDIRGRLLGEKSEAICNGLYLLKRQQLFDTHIFVDHAVPKCSSHEIYKGILDEKARAVFCGRILVQQDAQETDAVQSSDNLLLSRAARVSTMPQLEIYANDVKCTHGATIGELDEQALFYLKTRGIDPVQGHAMLTFAFANEVLEEMRCKNVKARIKAMVQAWLEREVDE